MELVIWIIIIAAVVVIFEKRPRVKKDVHVAEVPSSEPEPYNPYSKKQYFLTKAEYAFFNILKQITADKYLIFPQVNLASILDVNTDRWHTYEYRNPINRKIVDFVIFDKTYISPLLVIELDDFSHSFVPRRARDELVDEILGKAGITILHIKNQYNYNIPVLTVQVMEKLNPISSNTSKL